MPLVRCPICRKMFDSALTPAMPFCSERCRLIDLGHWLHEEYGIPVEPDDGDEESELNFRDDED